MDEIIEEDLINTSFKQLLPDEKEVYKKESNYISTFQNNEELKRELGLLLHKYIQFKFKNPCNFALDMKIQASILPHISESQFDEISHMYLDIQAREVENGFVDIRDLESILVKDLQNFNIYMIFDNKIVKMINDQNHSHMPNFDQKLKIFDRHLKSKFDDENGGDISIQERAYDP